MQLVGLLLIHAVPLPQQFGLIRADLQHAGAFVERREKQAIIQLARHRDAEAGFDVPWHVPQDFAGFRIQRRHCGRMPDNQLSSATEFINHRRTVSCPGIIERSPDFLAGDFVEADHQPIFDAADESNQFPAINKRRRGHAPDGQFRPKVFWEVLLPEDFAILDIHAEHVALRSDEVNAVFIDDRGCSRPGRIADGVSSKVLVLPKLFPSLGIEAQQSLELTIHDAIRQENSPISNGRA